METRNMVTTLMAMTPNRAMPRTMSIEAIRSEGAIGPAPEAASESRGSRPEIGNDHLPVRADLGRRAGGQHFPQIEHGHAIADVEDQIGMMFDQQHAGARPADRLDQRAEAA